MAAATDFAGEQALNIVFFLAFGLNETEEGECDANQADSSKRHIKNILHHEIGILRDQQVCQIVDKEGDTHNGSAILRRRQLDGEQTDNGSQAHGKRHHIGDEDDNREIAGRVAQLLGKHEHRGQRHRRHHHAGARQIEQEFAAQLLHQLDRNEHAKEVGGGQQHVAEPQLNRRGQAGVLQHDTRVIPDAVNAAQLLQHLQADGDETDVE
mmetsp:Transcript_16865/g.26829  ORF Transcript_16865/g.26829 Transcript_16865/m.26829 type:complete len:210 (-) Transcript_16865:1423-2052(-)